MSEHAPDYVAALEALLSLFHRLAVAQAVPEAVDNSLGDQEQLTGLANQITAEDVQLYYQIGINGRRDLPMASDPRSGFEMTLLRMLAFKPAAVGQLSDTAGEVPASVKKPPRADLGSRDQTESAAVPTVLTKSSNQGSESTSAMANPRSAPAAKKPVKKPESKTIASSLSAEPSPGVLSSESSTKESIPSAVLSSPLADEGTETQALTLADIDPALWAEQFHLLGLGGVVGNIVSHCLLEKVDGEVLFLQLDQNNATLFNDNSIVRIEEDITKALQQAVRVIVNVMQINGETPAARKTRVMSEQKQHAIDLLEKDPNVRRLIEDFDATLDLDSVTPLH